MIDEIVRLRQYISLNESDRALALMAERDEAIAAARELLMCWVPPEHQNDYLKHWDWLKVREPAAAPSAAPGVEEK